MVEQSIRKQLREKKKVLLLINKLGYASGVFCRSCGHVPQCQQCSISVGYHEASNGLLYGLCSICKSIYDLPATCPQCQQTQLQLYGLTTQKTKEWIQSTFDYTPLVIQAQDIASASKVTHTLKALQDASIVIATYALIPSVAMQGFDVVVVLAADQLLSLPDYTVRSQTFYTLTRIIEQFDTKFFLVQSYDTDQASIRLACKRDLKSFEDEDKGFRSQHSYPPYGELCIIKYNHENETTLHSAIQKLHQELSYLQEVYGYQEIEMYTSSPLVYKKFGKFYYHIILKGQAVRPFMDIAFSKLQMAKR